jgi:cell shape-determining protein MreC
MNNYLVELAFLLYGLYLLQEAQYLTLLILLLLSFILLSKGFKYKNSLIITIVILLFLTQYHRFFSSRHQIEQFNLKSTDEADQDEIEDIDDYIEGFRNNSNDRKYNEILAAEKKKRKQRRKEKKRLATEYKKFTASLPRSYIKNKKKIEKKPESWGDALSKWGILKENLFILLNK